MPNNRNFSSLRRSSVLTFVMLEIGACSVQKRLVKAVEGLFGLYGEFVASSWYWIIVASALLCVLCGCGWLRQAEETDEYNLWFAENSRFRAESQKILSLLKAQNEPFFPVEIIVSVEDGENILTAEKVAKILELRQTLIGRIKCDSISNSTG